MIKDKVDGYLSTFKKRQDHLAAVMQNGSSLAADDMSDSEKVSYISGAQSYIVDDGDTSYLIVDVDSCHRLEPYFELTDKCVNLGVDTHQAQLIPGTGADAMVVRLIPARPDYDFNFIESGDIQNLIDQRLVKCAQAYMDDLVEYLGSYTEDAIYDVLPQLNAQIQSQAEEMDVSFETLASHESVLKSFVKVVNDLMVDAAEKYAGLTDDAYRKLVVDATGSSEEVDDVLDYGALVISDASELKIDFDTKEWKKIDLFGDWPDGEVEVSLALVMEVAIKDNLEFISEVMEEKLAISFIEIARLIKQTAESSEMSEDELMLSSFVQVVLTRKMKHLVDEASEEAINRYDEESSDEIEGLSDNAQIDLENEVSMGMETLMAIEPNSSEAYVAACAAVMVCDNEIDEAELIESIKAAMKSTLMIEFVKTLGSENIEIEHSMSRISVDDYKEVLDQLTNDEVDSDASSEVVGEFNTLVNEFDPQASLAVIADVKNAWAAAQGDDREFELLDLIASKIDSDLSPWVLSSCLDIAKADGELQGEEQVVLERFASKWGQEEYLNKIFQALTGQSWSTLDVAERKTFLPTEDKEDVMAEKTEVSTLWKAIMEMDAEKAVRMIEAGAPVNDVIDFNSEIRDISPLMIAAEQFDEVLVKALIDAGADINAKACVGYVPLTWALKGENIDNFRILLAAGADPDPLKSGEGDYSPLSMAVTHGLDDAVKELIDAGVDVNRTNDDGQTSLKVAVMNQQTGCVRLLLGAGADPAKADSEGYAPIHNAARNGNIDIVNMLLDAGVDVNTPLVSPAEDEGETAINAACYAGHFGITKELIGRGAKSNDVGEPVLDAIIGAHGRSDDPTDMVKYLIDNGTKVNLKTLLHATLISPVPTFELLLKHLSKKVDTFPDGWLDMASKLIAEVLLKEEDEARLSEITNLLKAEGPAWVCDDKESGT